jgi:hypothetical protein
VAKASATKLKRIGEREALPQASLCAEELSSIIINIDAYFSPDDTHKYVIE